MKYTFKKLTKTHAPLKLNHCYSTIIRYLLLFIFSIIKKFYRQLQKLASFRIAATHEIQNKTVFILDAILINTYSFTNCNRSKPVESFINSSYQTIDFIVSSLSCCF